MTRKYFSFIFIAFTTLIFNVCRAQNLKVSTNQKSLQDVRQSHLDSNIPDKDHFDILLNRDLEKYFSTLYGTVTVHWEFLRVGPTQSGVSYPKYYLWTKVNNGQNLVTSGAVRVAAIDKTKFEITDYVDINQIRNKSTDIYSIFPRAVCEKIETYLK